MARGPRYHVQFRRRRAGKTDYRSRIALLKSGVPRAVVRKTMNNTIVQLVEFHQDGDRILTSATTAELHKFGWESNTGNLPAAYLAGYLAGKRAVEAGIAEAVLDIGRHVPSKGGRVFGALKGLVEAGLDIPHGEDVLPGDERLRGKHLKDPEAAAKMFEQVKAKLEG